MINKIIFYCKSLDQAVLVDVCKRRWATCKTPCLYQQAVKKLGRDDFYRPVAKRYASVEDIEKDRENLIFGGFQPMEEKKLNKPVVRPSPLRFSVEKLPDPPKFKTTSDILKEEIMKALE